MKAQLRTREVADFFPFVDIASLGARCGTVALFKSDAGCFGWRLTKRQVAALARAGFACRSWK